MSAPLHVVTGAFGYSGQYIARRLLAAGCRVRTLTNSPQREHPLRNQIEVHSFLPTEYIRRPDYAKMDIQIKWPDPRSLIKSLEGAEVLYNTYWVRFNHKTFTFESAIRNSIQLFTAAAKAGVRRIVHVSITNPEAACGLEYFEGKHVLEHALQNTACTDEQAKLNSWLFQRGLSYAILRPAVLFGMEDILINNIAWMLRRMPVFGVFGKGDYKLQPIFVDDLAALAVDQGTKRENVTLNAIGPETFTYRSLVETIGAIIGKPRRIVSVPPWLGYAIGRAVGMVTGDTVITRDEIRGLMQNRLYVETPPPALAVTKLTAWAQANREWLGSRYASELSRRRDRVKAYVAPQVRA